MIAAILALNKPQDFKNLAKDPAPEAVKGCPNAYQEDEAIKSGETLLTGDSSGVILKGPAPLQEGDEALDGSPKETGKSPKSNKDSPFEEFAAAIRTLAKPFNVDPFARHDFDSFIVECF